MMSLIHPEWYRRSKITCKAYIGSIADLDSRLAYPRPRPRLVKTGLETSRDQDSSLENSQVCGIGIRRDSGQLIG